MNKKTEFLINKVNQKLLHSPLFYFSRDIERGIGLENYLQNYFLVSVEDNYIVDSLNQKRVFCAEKNKIRLKNNSTNELINSEEVINWIKKVSKNSKFYAQLFQFNQPAFLKIEKARGEVLNNPANLNRKFEDKISQFKILKDNGINIPQSEVLVLERKSLSEFLNSLNLKIHKSTNEPIIVLQLAKAHTGSGTFFVKNEEEWSEIVNNYAGNEVRVSEYINGDSYTLNACITKSDIFIAGLQYQITGIPELTPGPGSTVGNDFSFANKLHPKLKEKIFLETKKIAEVMKKDGYRGLFGVDFVITQENVFVIEINARQTANIPFQTKLEIEQNQTPLALINLCEWLDIPIDFEPNSNIQSLEGSQIFLRSFRDNFEINNQIKSGIYRLQSDNSAKLKEREDVIYIDEEQDKPLIWQKDGYSIEEIGEGGFVLLLQKKGSVRDKFDEIARMQFTSGIILEIDSKAILSPWILEAMREIKSRL